MNQLKNTILYFTLQEAVIMTEIDAEDENVFNDAYFYSQDVIKSSENHMNVVAEELRNDLLEYLTSVDNKVDSEGNKLVKVPSNFNKIVSSMTRADLVGGESDNQWSRTLLEQQFVNDFEGGRYRNIFRNEESKIQKGLAEIHVLDSRLKESARKASEMNRNLSTMSEPANFDSKNQRTTPRSLKESIFITRPKTFETSSEAGSRRDDMSSRGSNLASLIHDDNMTEREEANEDQNNNSFGNYNEDEKASKEIAALLSQDEELRLQAILHDDFEKLNPYMSDFNHERLSEIDTKLEAYGRLGRLQPDDFDEELMRKHKIIIDDKAKDRGQGSTYLQEQVR
jgi:hypothetical protein